MASPHRDGVDPGNHYGGEVAVTVESIEEVDDPVPEIDGIMVLSYCWVVVAHLEQNHKQQDLGLQFIDDAGFSFS